MSTDFLNRRMDLSHSIKDGYNILRMDTSYPVKIAGKIIKLFVATTNYNPSMGYKLFNTEDKNPILTISIDNVYDFGGRVIKDSIGPNQSYPNNTSVYKVDDYVMAVIDFDNGGKIFLCSQTNFKNFQNNDNVDGKVRIYDITGDNSPNKTDINFDYDFDISIFNSATAFESEENKNALVKFSEDEVLYEAPKEIFDPELPTIVKGREITPVAKINVLNINSLNATVNRFMFAYIDNINDKGGTEYIDKLAGFVQFNGSMNYDFINKFALSEQDMLNLKIVSESPERIKRQLLEEYYNIDASIRSKYKYILMAKVDRDDFDISTYTNNMHFIPINPDTGTFTSLFELYNRGFVVDGEKVELPSDMSIYGNTLGQLEHNDYRDMYCIYYDLNTYLKINMSISHYNTSNEVSRVDYFNSDKRPYLYGHTSVPPSSNTPQLVISGDMTIKDSFNSYLSDVSKFLKFFVPNDSIGIYNNILALLNKHILNLSSNKMGGHTTLHYCDIKPSGSDTPSYVLPNTVITEYPEIFDSKIDGTTTILDYTLDGVKKVEKFKRVSPKNHTNIMSIIYKLFNRKGTNSTSGYIDNYKTRSNKIAKIYKTGDTTPEDSKYIFKATRSLSSNEGSDTFNTGTYAVYEGRYDGMILMFSPISLLSVNMVGSKTINSTDYIVPEVSSSNFLVAKEVYNATSQFQIPSTSESFKLIEIYNNNSDVDNGKLRINVPIFDQNNTVTGKNTYQLYIVTVADLNETSDYISGSIGYIYKPANINDTYLNFKSPNTDRRGSFLYMYYEDNNNMIHRIKYYYNNLQNRAIEDFDYFTDNIIIDTTGIDVNNFSVSDLMKFNNINNHYMRAAINVTTAKDQNNNNAIVIARNLLNQNNAINRIIATVAVEYDLFIGTGDVDEGSYISYKADYLDISSNYNLTIGLDERIIYGGSPNTGGISSYTSKGGIRLSDMVNSSDITIHKDMITPLYSDTKDLNGGTIYNIKAYLDLIKGTNLNKGINDFGLYNAHQELNICGISHKLLFTNSGQLITTPQFYQYALTRDLKEFNDGSNGLFTEVEPCYRAMINPTNLTNLSLKLVYDKASQTDEWCFYNDNSNTYVHITGRTSTDSTSNNSNNLIFHTNIDPTNLFGINPITIYSLDTDRSYDVTSNYTNNNEKIFINEIMTGKRISYSLSMADSEDFISPSLTQTNGLSGTIETDELNWNKLLLTLTNNMSIDILGTNLKDIKSSLNSKITEACQNISDTITMQENNATISNATKTAAESNAQPFNTSDNRYHEYPAEFNSDLNVYDFYFGYGYIGTTFNRHKILNNRGVIVFTTENGDSFMNQSGQELTQNFSTHPSEIRPKRMYVSKDGLICTKEYFDREESIYSEYQNYPVSYPEGTSIAELKKQIEELTARVKELEDELHPNP